MNNPSVMLQFLLICLLSITVVLSIVSGVTSENYRRRQLRFPNWSLLKVFIASIFGGAAGAITGNLLGTLGTAIPVNYPADPAVIIGFVSSSMCFIGSSLAIVFALETFADISPLKEGAQP